LTRHRILFLMLLFVSSAASAAPHAVAHKERGIAGRYLVTLDDRQTPDAHAAAAALTRAHGGRIRRVWESAVRGFSLDATAEEAALIAQSANVMSVEEDEIVPPQQTATCAQTTSRCADGKLPWQLDRIDQWSLPLDGKYWHITPQGRGAVVFILDSGILASHSEFNDGNGRSRVLPGVDFVNDGNGTNDCYSHGTYVASLAVGRTAGAARDAKVVPVRIGDCTGYTTIERLVDGFSWVKDNFRGYSLYSVANLSYRSGVSTILTTASNNLAAAGVIVTIGAGNDSGNACNYSPANSHGRGVVVVAASTRNDFAASSTNQGMCVSVFAPGEGVGGDAYSYDGLNCNPGWNGTSVAAPLVAGIFAMYWSNHPTLSSFVAINQVLGGSTVGQLHLASTSTSPNLLIANPYDPWMSCDVTAPPPDVR